MHKAVKVILTNMENKTEWIKDRLVEWSGKVVHHFPLSTQFRDMSNDHPQDEWEINDVARNTGSNRWADIYTLRNKRTGDVKRYNDDCSSPKPFRGKVVTGQDGNDKDVEWLNNQKYNRSRR